MPVVSQEKWWGRLWCWWENPTSEGQGKFFPLLENSFGIHWLRLQRGIMELWQEGQRCFKEMRSMCCLHIFESTGGAGRHGGGSGQWDPAGHTERGVWQHSAPHRRVGFRQQLVRDRLSTGLASSHGWKRPSIITQLVYSLHMPSVVIGVQGLSESSK